MPNGMIVSEREYRVATLLAQSGDDVCFIPTRIIKTPDIFYLNLEWEIKSPIGSSSRTLENNLRNAAKQSPNVIIDLGRIKIPESTCLREIKRQKEIIRQIKRIIIVTKDEKIIKLF